MQSSYHSVYSFDLSREVVAVSLNLFDRYLATLGNQCTGNLALLTSLTTLHIAIKLFENKKIKIATLANLSRGQFGARHIEEMEWKILASLGWNLHPPTEYAFVSHLLLFLPNEASQSVRKELFELSRYLTELAVCDSYFVEFKNSTVAFSAILNVMEDISYARLSAGIRVKFLRDLSQQVGLSYSDSHIVAARSRLRAMFAATAGSENSSPIEQINVSKKNQEIDTCSQASSIGSTGSHKIIGSNHSRSGSVDSKGSYRYSPSPRRRFLMSSPSSRAHVSSSPIVAIVQ